MKDLKLIIRKANISDIPEMQKMFVDTITAVCTNDYSDEQIKVWTSSIENKNRWEDKMATQFFLIAEHNSGIVGFASLENHNYLDFLYVHKNYQRHGIAGNLYTEIENEALRNKTIRLNSDVSITAKHFFEKKGFHVIKSQSNIIDNIEIVNFKMTKIFDLSDC